MPQLASPFTSVPNAISRPAQPISPQVAAALSGGGGPPAGNLPAPPGTSDPNEEPDLFQRVAQLITENPMWVLIFAGMGMREALEKTGKFVSKPHRSNEELASQGYNVGMAGQTGVPSQEQLARQLAPPTGGAGMPGFV